MLPHSCLTIMAASNLASSMSTERSKPIVTEPEPLEERDFILLIPCILASIDSSRLVTSDSTVLADPVIEKLTVREGKASEGDSLTGNLVEKAHPNKAKAMKMTMTEKEGMTSLRSFIQSTDSHDIVELRSDRTVELEIVKREFPYLEVIGPVVL